MQHDESCESPTAATISKGALVRSHLIGTYRACGVALSRWVEASLLLRRAAQTPQVAAARSNWRTPHRPCALIDRSRAYAHHSGVSPCRACDIGLGNPVGPRTAHLVCRSNRFALASDRRQPNPAHR